MAVMPTAKWRPLPENSTQKHMTPTQVILHTAVDGPSVKSLFGFFSNRSVHVESHFYVAKSGVIEQYMDTSVQAHANYGANKRAISIETWDGGDPEGNPWNEAQLTSIVAIIEWAGLMHGIPLQVCPTHTEPGIGYHAMFGFRDPLELDGAQENPWSPSFGKTCPGRTRVKQFYEVILPLLWGDDEQEDIAVALSPGEAELAVIGAYKALLKREPDAQGRDHWVGLLTSGQLSKVDFLLYFMSSAGDELVSNELKLQRRLDGMDALQGELDEAIEELEHNAPEPGNDARPAVTADEVISELTRRLNQE